MANTAETREQLSSYTPTAIWTFMSPGTVTEQLLTQSFSMALNV
jgi:hypothetical protein